jgi:hypothetical protein
VDVAIRRLLRPAERHLSARLAGRGGRSVLLVAVAQAILGSVAGFFCSSSTSQVLYLTVELGPFHRRFMELQLLIGAGEERSARSALARWSARPAFTAIGSPRARAPRIQR